MRVASGIQTRLVWTPTIVAPNPRARAVMSAITNDNGEPLILTSCPVSPYPVKRVEDIGYL
jgi:hypothetical protein